VKVRLAEGDVEFLPIVNKPVFAQMIAAMEMAGSDEAEAGRGRRKWTQASGRRAAMARPECSIDRQSNCRP
jgi:hypothetical protein